ncbi:MAG: chemotaxis protein CheW [Xenococcaceae cyanobacterium MO_188.B29]|nr:chemotaxis protein CheW [Xenococcaceae cyanobacterium MO_188.B29]
MNQEYFVVELSTSIQLGLPLVDMATVAQFEQKDICVVPGVASFWYGVVNFKGSLLWILETNRFFDLDVNLNATSDRLNSKLTSVLLTHQIRGTQRRVALVVQKLQGLLKVESSKLKSLPASEPSSLQNLCTAAVETENQITYILDSAAFLEQLHQQSTLVCA